ncbi:hypothetical protein GCM10023108_54260 [Saccharopolyspora hordei]
MGSRKLQVEQPAVRRQHLSRHGAGTGNQLDGEDRRGQRETGRERQRLPGGPLRGDRGSCATIVGTSDTETFLVNYQIGSEGRGNPEYENPCGMADKIAGMVLENLPPA